MQLGEGSEELMGLCPACVGLFRLHIHWDLSNRRIRNEGRQRGEEVAWTPGKAFLCIVSIKRMLVEWRRFIPVFAMARVR